MNTAATDQRPSGIPAAGELPSGSHFCVFYASQQELLDVLVPFVRAGLECNELCSWEVHPPLTAAEVTAALTRSVPAFAEHVARGQIDVVSPPEELAPRPRADEALERQLDRAILGGFDGLRIVRHAEDREEGRALAAAVETLGRLNVIAALPSPRADLGVVDLMERVQEHPFALICNFGRWEVLKGSEARTAHDALERSEEKLQSLFGNMSEGFAYHRAVVDARGRPCDYVFLEVNPAFERLTGLAAQRILGKRVTRVLPGIEADPTDWIGKFGRVALTGEPTQFESHAVALDRWYAVSAFSSRRGYFAVALSDITDRKRAEAQRRAAEERLLVTLRSIGDAVISTDTAGRAIMLNRVAEELTGFTQAEAAGRPLREIFNIVHEETGEPAEDPVRKVIESGAVVGLANDTALVGRDGRRMSIADSAAPVRSESGELLGVVLVFRDVTEARRAERALHEANQRLQDADRRKDEFLAVLSHELRNPLAPIQNSLYILDRAAPGGHQARRSLEVIRRQATHLARLVDDLLDVTRIVRGKIELRRARVDAREVVRRTAEDFHEVMKDRSLVFGTVVPEGSVWIDADATRIAQVVGNLLHNAAKFTHPGDEVTLSLQPHGGHAEIRVRDTGPGIEPDLLPNVFDAFVQGKRTLARTEGGLGLGLALVKGIAELHGGTVRAESAGKGKGAQFVVRLPLLDPATAQDSATLQDRSRPGARPRNGARRVLVVDDNVDAARSLAEIVEMLGHAAEVAYDGPSAVAKARANAPDVVLCDIGLPGMSGHEVAQALRACGAMVQLFAVSGYAQPEDVKGAVAAGFDGHVAKPVDPEDIERLLA